jgi:integrase
VLHAIFSSAEREELIESNPARRVERPRYRQKKWRILQPAEVPAVAKAFDDDRARRVFLTLMLTGLRRHELVGLRWGDVNMIEGVLRVRKSKSEEGVRSIALSPSLVGVFAEQFQASPFRSDHDYAFAHPERGVKLETSKWYPEQFRKALTAAGITD